MRVAPPRLLLNVLIPAAILALAAPPSAAAPRTSVRVMVCQPGGPSLKPEEQETLNALYRYLESRLALGEGSVEGAFFNERAACDQEIATGKPGLMLIPTSMILDLEASLKLAVGGLLKSKGRTEDSYYLMTAAEGGADKIEALRGRTLTGNTLSAPRFVARVVLEGKLGAAADLVLQPERLGLRGVRKVASGKADAVLLDGEQYRALKGSRYEAELKLVFTSQPVPNPAVMVVPGRTPPDFAARLGPVLVGMRDDPKGREVLDTFGIDGFVKVGPEVWGQVRKRLGGGR